MSFPDDPLDITVSVAYGADPNADPSTWSFTAISDPDPEASYVRQSVFLARGRSGEQGSAQPAVCRFDIRNPDGIFSEFNVVGPNYGEIGLNTPIRVEVNPGTGDEVRSTTFASAWPPRWTGPDLDDHVPMLGNGILRRLGQGNAPTSSLLKAAILADNPTFYWPMEDGSDATSAASAKTGKPRLIKSGTLAFADDGSIIGSDPIPSFTAAGKLAATLSGTLTSTQAWAVEFSTGTTPDGFYVPVRWASTGTIAAWDFVVLGGIFVNAFDATGDVLVPSVLSAALTAAVLAEPHNWVVTATQSGTSINFELYMDGALLDTGTIATQTLGGRITSVQVNPYAAVTPFSLGHLAIYNTAAHTGHVDEFGGLAGEISGTRVQRLCDERGIPVDVAAGSTVTMGPQTSLALVPLLAECEAAEVGLLVERRTGELGFDPHSARENLPVTLTLDYEEGHVRQPFLPIFDDRFIRNDVTVTRSSGGASSTVTKEDGPLAIATRGRYEDTQSLNLETDEQTLDLAGWLLNLGTVYEQRFPTIALDLHWHPELIPDWLACDIGSRIQITNAPAQLVGPNTLDLVIEGYTETLEANEWHVELNCAPYAPYHVGVLAEETMTLLTAEDTTSTTWRVACDPSFTTASDDLPVQLIVGGEVVTVTAVSPVTPAIVAGTPAHADNASVTPANPAHIEGDLLLLIGAIRNSGTGTVDSVGGIWTPFAGTANVKISYAYATSAATPNPTVNFTGGAAGETTSAVVLGCRGLQLIDAQKNQKAQLNGSAQDIAFPVYVQEGDTQIMHVAWKQDDYTSVAAGTGLTEVVEASTTTGNDQSLYVARGTTANPALPIPAGSNVVTGGASAISRAFFFTFLRGVADLTVTRSVNGVVTSHAQLADVQVYQPAVLAL